MLETIKSSTEISRLFSNGKRIKASAVTILVDRCEGQHGHDTGRVAFIAGKRLGNAVWRNAAKRRLRAIARDLGGPWSGYDVVFMARSSVLDREYAQLLASCREAIGKAIRGGCDE